MEAHQHPRILPVVMLAILSLPSYGAVRHPLDALEASEITATTDILRSAGEIDDKTLIASITLEEPPKADVLAWKAGEPIMRRAKAVLRRRSTTVEAVVDLDAGKVASLKEIPGAQPFVTLTEVLTAIEITTADPRMQVGLRKRGITDFEKLFCAPRTVGNFGTEAERTKRIVKVDCFDIRDVKTDVFANPIEGLFATVDLDRNVVLDVRDLPWGVDSREEHPSTFRGLGSDSRRIHRMAGTGRERLRWLPGHADLTEGEGDREAQPIWRSEGPIERDHHLQTGTEGKQPIEDGVVV